MGNESTDLVVQIPSPLPSAAVNVSVEIARDIKRRLSAKTPQKYIKRRPGPINGRTGNRMEFQYVQWGYVARVLNDTFGPAWSYNYDMAKDVQRIKLPNIPAKPAKGREPGSPEKEREEVMVTVTLTTPFGTQTATASHTYWPNNDQILFGDVVQSAASKALTRAASRIGVALDLRLGDDAEEFDTRAALAESADQFKGACVALGITLRAGIVMLSQELAGDGEALQSSADVIEAAGGLDEAVALLEVVAERIKAMPLEAIEPDEMITPPVNKAKTVKKA